jgi:glycolate oxidase FAD binding subunit
MEQETIHEFGDFPEAQVARPSTVTELGQIVRDAGAKRQAVFPLGGRTMLQLGYPPNKPGIAVELRRLDQVNDYPARDMTITVQAGITIAKLQEILAKENQQLPIDVPLPDKATLGGAISVNASGPRRHGYGTLRDYVIGISFVNDEGHEVKAGGRVVKNVAGYDLMKLHIGALGTLGIVTQVTLKLRPIPERQAVGRFHCYSSELESVCSAVHRSNSRPVIFELLNKVLASGLSGGHEERWEAFVGFEGNKDALDYQMNQVRESLNGLGREFIQGEGSVIAVLKEGASDCWGFDSLLTFKANLLPSAVCDFCRVAEGLQIDCCCIQSHAGIGIVVGHLYGDLTLDQARTMLTTLQAAAGPNGNVVVVRCPTKWKRELPIWGKPRRDHALMRRVKQSLDPRGIFNPGRFVDGI